MRKIVTLLVVSLFNVGAWASCYTVLGPKGEVLSESTNPPVDMSLPLHQSVPDRFGPGAVLVFGIADGNCGSTVDRYDKLLGTKAGQAGNALVPVSASSRPARRDRE
ncbi:hypothetical protein [Ottowia caeni]|uniref:hypothetical protein n=1 Tax=Ottowia caeni TaxID=2870339 RepID=UPI001E58EF3D|nr:hypothetical protein [Ottowia caeni]